MLPINVVFQNLRDFFEPLPQCRTHLGHVSFSIPSARHFLCPAMPQYLAVSIHKVDRQTRLTNSQTADHESWLVRWPLCAPGFIGEQSALYMQTYILISYIHLCTYFMLLFSYISIYMYINVCIYKIYDVYVIYVHICVYIYIYVYIYNRTYIYIIYIFTNIYIYINIDLVCCSIVTFIILCHNVCSPTLLMTKFLTCLTHISFKKFVFQGRLNVS